MLLEYYAALKNKNKNKNKKHDNRQAMDE